MPSNSKKYYGAITISSIKDGKNALSVDISAPTQFFKSSNGTTYVPASIILTPVFQGGATYRKWQYSLNGENSWTDINSSTNGVTIGKVNSVDNCLTIQNTSTLFNTSASSVSFRVNIVESDDIYDVMTLAKITDGSSGSNGYNNAVIYLYKASATPIESITWSSSIIYYFDTNNLSFIPEGWSRDIPESDDPIYMTAATAYSNSMSYTISSSIWTDPILFVKNGEDGTNGQDGQDGTNGTNGVDGKSVKRIDEYYVVSEKSTGVTIENTSGWSTSIPDFTTTKRYLWNYTVTILSDDSELPATTPKVIGTKGIDGQDGQDGNDGKDGAGIKEIQNYFLVSSKNTGITNDELAHSWQTTPPTLTPTNKYLWTFEKITFDNTPATITKTQAMIIGAYGNTGQNGQDGEDGKDGRSITAVIDQYYLSDSYEYAEGGSWSDNPVVWVKGKYVWTRNKISYSDGSSETTSGICVTGVGLVENVDVYYCLSDSNTTPPSSGWTKTYPGWVDGKYLWSKTVTSYSDGRSDTETAPVCISGSKGNTGVGIVNVQEMYLASSLNSGVTESTSGWSNDPTTQMMTASKRYLWNYEVTQYSNSTIEKTTPKIIGVYGDQGGNGKDGVSITGVKNMYLATSSTSVTKETSGWTETIQTMNKDKKYLWNYEIINYSNGSKSESEPVIIGAFGVDGNSITGIVEQYAQTDSSSIQPVDSAWSSERPDYDPYKYMWTRSIINYSDKSSDYTTPICVAGPSPTVYSLNCSTYAISRKKNNSYNPSSITVSGKKQTGDNPLEDFSCRFRIEESTNGTSWTAKYSSSSDETSHVYTPSSGIVAIRCSMYKQGGFTELIDQQQIPIVNEGVDGIDGEDGSGYTVLLSNEAHSFPAGTTYAISSNTSTKIIALKNSSPIAATITKINNTAVTSSVAIVTGLTASVTGNGTTDCTINFTATGSLNIKSGVIPIEITVDGNTFTKEFSYSLALTGQKGSDSISYNMIMSSYVIAKKSDGSLETTSIKLVGKSSQGSSAPVNYSGRFMIEKATNDEMTTWQTVYTSSSNENQYAYTIPSDVKGLRCSMYLAGGTTNLLDQQIIPIVSDGAPGKDGQDGKDGVDGENGADGTGYTIVLSNESHVFAAGVQFATGGVATTSVIGYKNATKIATNITKINDVAVSGTSAIDTGITGLKASVSNNNTTSTSIRFTAETTLSQKDGIIPIAVTIDGKEFIKNFSFSLSLSGSDGEDGNSVESVDVYYCLSTSNTTPPTEGWTTNAPQWVDGKYVWSKTITTFSDPGMENVETDPVCISGSKGSTGVGFKGIIEYYLATTISTASSLPAVGSSSWKTTPQQITATNRYLWNYEVTEYTNGDKSEPTTPKLIGVFGQKGDAGNNGVSITGVSTYYYASTEGTGISREDPDIDWDQDPTTQKLTSVKKYLWKYDEISYSDNSKTYTDAYLAGTYGDKGDKGDTGVAGINSATVYLYKRSSSVPSKPTTDSIYTFSSKTLTGNDIGTGKWERVIPDGTLPVYVITATASSNAQTDTIPASEWSTPVVLAKNGADGLKGYSTAVVYLYRRSATVPTKDWTESLVYNFSEKSLTTVPTNWSKTIPSGTNPLYITMATAFSNQDTVSLPVSVWTTPVLFVQNGTNGTNGTNGKDGLNSATVYLYKRSSSTPSKPTGKLTYTFSSGDITENTSGALNGWSSLIPTGNNPLYVIMATANSTAASDEINTDEWSTPVVLAQNGSNGTAGYNNAIIQLYKRSSTPITAIDWSSDIVYTFSTNSINTTPSGWSRNVPSGSNPLYMTAATAYANTSTKTIKSTEWSTPILLVQNGADGKDGTNGSPGENGYNVATVYLYARSTSKPSVPTANVTYTFSTGVASGTDIGSGKTWQTSIPDGTNPIYVITATAISKSDTYTIAFSKWSNPVKLAQNGIDGTPATTVLLSNECYTFSADSEGKGIPASVKCDVYGYKGTTAVTTTIGTATNVPTGMTVSVSNSSTTSTLSSFTVTITNAMTKLSGYIEIPITCNGITFKKKFSYSLSKEGDPGRTFIVEPSVNIISRKINKVTTGGVESTTININPNSVTFKFYQRTGVEEAMEQIQCNYTISTSTNGSSFTDKTSSSGSSCTYTITENEYNPKPNESGVTADPIKAIQCTIKSLTDNSIVLARVIVAIVDEVNNDYIEEEFQTVYTEIDKWHQETVNTSALISKDVTNAEYRLENLLSKLEGGNIYEFDDEGNLVYDDDGEPLISQEAIEGLNSEFEGKLETIRTNISEIESNQNGIMMSVSDFTSKLIDTKVPVLGDDGLTTYIPAYDSFVQIAQQVMESALWQIKFMEGTVETASMKFEADKGLTVKTSNASGELNENRYETVITGTDFSCYYNEDFENPVFHLDKDEFQTARLKVHNGIDLTNLKIVNCSQSKDSKNVVGIDFVTSIKTTNTES